MQLRRNDVFHLERVHFDGMVAHAREKYPNEACGILAGKDGRIVKLYRTTNAEDSPVRYVVEPREQLTIMREIEAEGWELLGIFHSHTHSHAYPSHTDVQMAYFDEALYFIVSLMDGEAVVRAYHIVGGQITEREIFVVE